MTIPDLDRRIEAMLKIIGPSNRCLAEALARAFAPELFVTPPTHWLAPLEVSREMYNAYVKALPPIIKGNMQKCSRRNKAKLRFAAMRDAYLAKQSEGSGDA
jgi:hypothetical protein